MSLTKRIWNLKKIGIRIFEQLFVPRKVESQTPNLMLKFHVVRTPLMLISNGFESSPEFAAAEAAAEDDVAALPPGGTDSSSLPLRMDDASLLLLLFCLGEQ